MFPGFYVEYLYAYVEESGKKYQSHNVYFGPVLKVWKDLHVSIGGGLVYGEAFGDFGSEMGLNPSMSLMSSYLFYFNGFNASLFFGFDSIFEADMVFYSFRAGFGFGFNLR